MFGFGLFFLLLTTGCCRLSRIEPKQGKRNEAGPGQHCSQRFFCRAQLVGPALIGYSGQRCIDCVLIAKVVAADGPQVGIELID